MEAPEPESIEDVLNSTHLCSSKVFVENGIVVDAVASTSSHETNGEREPHSEMDDDRENDSDESDPLVVEMRNFEWEWVRKNFQLAKQMLKDEDLVKAVALLKIVCSDFRSHCDDESEELADVYTTYGIALLRLHRRRRRLRTVSTILIDRVGTNNNVEKISKRAVVALPKKKWKSDEDLLARYRARVSNVSSEEDTEDEVEVDVDEKEEEKEKDDLMPLIFEMFEKAKKILVSKRDHVNLSNVFSKLGEANAEVGNFQTAVEEFMFSLYILEKLSATGYMRQKTVLHFQIFLTLFKAWRYCEAESALMQALSIATVYLQTLRIKSNTLHSANNAQVKQLSREIEQIEELVIVMTRSAANVRSVREEGVQTWPRQQEDEVAELLSTMSILKECPSSSKGSTSPPTINIPPHLQSKPIAFKHQRILSIFETIDLDLINDQSDENCVTSGGEANFESDAGTVAEDAAGESSFAESEDNSRKYKRKADSSGGKVDEAESSAKKSCGLPSVDTTTATETI